MMETNLSFKTEEDITFLIDAIARQINRRIDKQSPILDSRLADGSRVNATIPPISPNGPTLTIRKFKEDPLTIVDLIKSGTLNTNLAAFLWLCIDGLGVKPANILIAGGTSSGKTTTLNALSSFISPRERIVSIEDTLELQIPKEHVLPMETRPPNIEGKGEIDMDILVKNSLRQRPDRVIVGEVRGKEAITLFTALNTGHSGFGTLHANNSRETISRLINPPMDVPKIMISAIDFIIMQKRIYKSDGVSFRRVSEVAEVVGMEEGTVQLNKVFEWNPKNDIIENVGISSNTIQSIAKLKGILMEDVEKDLTSRNFLLDFLVNNNINSINDFNYYIEAYYNNADALINEIVSITSAGNID
ncbi:MAG: CpaF family protein, partial [Methanobacteriaceae archaeon]